MISICFVGRFVDARGGVRVVMSLAIARFVGLLVRRSRLLQVARTLVRRAVGCGTRRGWRRFGPPSHRSRVGVRSARRDDIALVLRRSRGRSPGICVLQSGSRRVATTGCPCTRTCRRPLFRRQSMGLTAKRPAPAPGWPGVMPWCKLRSVQQVSVFFLPFSG